MPAPLEPAVRGRLRSKLLELARRFPNPDRAQSDIGRLLKISPSQISRLLADPPEGGSLTLIRKLAKELNEPPDFILNGNERPAPVRKLRELPGFAHEFEEARRRATLESPHLTREDLERAADTRAEPEPLAVTAGLLIQLALARKAAPPPRTKTKKS